MPLNIGHAQDAYLGGESQFLDFIERFSLEFFKPIRDDFTHALLQTMPKQTRDDLRELAPEAYDEVIESLDGGEKYA